MSHYIRTTAAIASTVFAVAAIAFVSTLGVSRALHDGSAAPAKDGQAHTYAPGLPHSYAKTQKAAEPQAVEPDSTAIEETLAGLDRAVFVSASLSQAAPSTGYDHGDWLTETIAAPQASNDDDLLQPIWEAELAQGAIADRIAGTTPNLADVIVDSTITAQTPDGSLRTVGGGSGDVSSNQEFAAQASGMSDEELAAGARAVLNKFGLTSVELRVLHPLGPAVSIRASVSDLGALDGKFESLINALNPDQAKIEGLYLEIDDVGGKPAVRVSQALRAGVGQVWFRPGLDDALGIPHG